MDFAPLLGPLARLLFPESGAQYDIVGFNPRGIGRWTALRCFGNSNQVLQAFSPVPFQVVPEEVPLFEIADVLLDDQCTGRGNRILEHMSTANVARDLEYMRQAFGENHLNFLGLSYGSYLGQTSANLFLDHVGAVIIDGILDPVTWANVGSAVPFSTALRADPGAQATLAEFLSQCEEAGPAFWALAPNAEDRFNDLLDRLRDGPIPIQDPSTGDTSDYLYSFFAVDVLGALYNQREPEPSSAAG